MTPNVIPFYGTIQQCWDILYSEYNRLEKILGRTPFTFEFPKHADIHDYIPKDGDEIYFEFWDSEHRHEMLSIEVEVVPEGLGLYKIFVHAHGNVFEEPLKSILPIWMEIKNAMQARGYLTDPHLPPSGNPDFLPPEPPSGSTPFTWLDWRLEMLKANGKYKLILLAPKIPISYSRLKAIHRQYKAEHGLVTDYEKQYLKRYQN
jgi:hypothetical protein